MLLFYLPDRERVGGRGSRGEYKYESICCTDEVVGRWLSEREWSGRELFRVETGKRIDWEGCRCVKKEEKRGGLGENAKGAGFVV